MYSMFDMVETADKSLEGLSMFLIFIISEDSYVVVISIEGVVAINNSYTQIY